MGAEAVRVRVPATTANLGPGFDCLGLALDLWNETIFERNPQGAGVRVQVEGEGQGQLPEDVSNLVAQSFLAFASRQGVQLSGGLTIICKNSIPLGSGLGSSGAAVLAGLLGAAALLNARPAVEDVLRLAVEIEGHADNAAPALLGGLVVVLAQPEAVITRRFELPRIPLAVVLPAVDLPTRAARAALPKEVSLQDAVYNIGRAALVVEALRTGDLALLGQVMDDRLHQPYRFALIPGAQRARQAALDAGAAAVALSGAGPSLAAFGGAPARSAHAMWNTFNEEGIESRAFLLETTHRAAWVEKLPALI